MATKKKLKRGFIKEAEGKAIDFRGKLGIHPWGPLCAFKLAGHLGIAVYKANEILPPAIFDGILSSNCGWSALTMKTKVGNQIIIHNPFHSPERQQSDVMHELSHIICEHEVDEKYRDVVLPIGMRQFNELQEEEAIRLGAILQIAKPGLFWAKKRNMDIPTIAAHFNASVEMTTYRLNTSGIEKNYKSKWH